MARSSPRARTSSTVLAIRVPFISVARTSAYRRSSWSRPAETPPIGSMRRPSSVYQRASSAASPAFHASSTAFRSAEASSLVSDVVVAIGTSFRVQYVLDTVGEGIPSSHRSFSRYFRQQVALERVERRPGAGRGVDLVVDVGDVVADRPVGENEPRRDLLVGESPGDQPQNLDLPAGEAGRPLAA